MEGVSKFLEFLQGLSWGGVFISVIGLLILACLFVIIIAGKYFVEHPEKIMDRITKYSEEKHAKSFAYRMESSPKIEDCLDKLVLESDAARAFIIEMHNGKYNSAGLSFNYGAMNYESVNEGIESVRDDYVDFTLERFQLCYKVYKDGFWSGTIDELSKVDKRLALRMRSNDTRTDYLAVVMIYGENSEIGFLGITYHKGDEIDEEKTHKLLMKYAAQLSPLLDGSMAEK